jgi:hypothetical protein
LSCLVNERKAGIPQKNSCTLLYQAIQVWSRKNAQK